MKIPFAGDLRKHSSVIGFKFIKAFLAYGLVFVALNIICRITKDTGGTILFDDHAVIVYKKLHRIHAILDVEHSPDVRRQYKSS